MSCKAWGGIISLLLVPFFSWGQTLKIAPLPYRVCEFKPVYVVEKDSLRRQVVLDSIAVLLPGRWQLVEAGAGACFTPPYAPDQYTEMILDGQGYGVVYQGGKLLTSFQLRLSFYQGLVHFIMEETRNPAYFKFFPSSLDNKAGLRYRPTIPFAYAYKNNLQVCEETLHLYGPRTGLSFVFKRLPTRYGPEP